jgi:uncharacterized protein YbjT (DUF2867 family)
MVCGLGTGGVGFIGGHLVRLVVAAVEDALLHDPGRR